MLFGVNFDYAVDRHSQGFGGFFFGDLPALRFEPTGGCEALTGVACSLCASISHYFLTAGSRGILRSRATKFILLILY